MSAAHTEEHSASGVTPVRRLHDRQPDGHGPEVSYLEQERFDGPASDYVLELETQVVQLQVALLTQRQIGAVIGVMAQRFGCTTDQAWRALVRLSQHTNIKVRVAARVLGEAFNGQAKDEDAQLLADLAAHLPPSGWPGLRPQGVPGKR